MAPKEQLLIMKSLNVKEHLPPFEDEVMNACREMQPILSNDEMTNNEAEDAIDKIRSTSSNNDVKIASRIVSDLLLRLLNNSHSNNHKQGEAALIIESIRPYLMHCLVSQIDSIKFEWLTYRLTQPPDEQVMIPDFVLLVEPSSAITYELLFLEVKRKGNFQNNHLENDLIKLGKEMHTALNKLILNKVHNPEVIGLWVEDHELMVYKMNLKYNGQYCMIEISRFHFARDCADDVLLIPAILEKLNQIKEIIHQTIANLYSCIKEDQDVVDVTGYVRNACHRPVPIHT